MSEPHSAHPVRPDPRQPAHDAVYDYIRSLGSEMPTDPVHRNAMIWRAFHAAIDATPVGRCVSSHCVEGDHILDLGETVPEEKPRASVIEIIAKGRQPAEDGAGSIIVPREVRINGVSVFTADRDNRIKVSDIQLGDDMVSVTLTLVVRRLVIAADGDLDTERGPTANTTKESSA